MKDPRKARGRVYELVFVLMVSLIAALAGAAKFRQVGSHVADLPQSLLGRLGRLGGKRTDDTSGVGQC